MESVHEEDLDEHVELFKDYASEIIRLELVDGEIFLVPAKHGQTNMTMSAQVSSGYRHGKVAGRGGGRSDERKG